eukprot:NODE_106_length_19857_cov_0.799980.p1 type:complete len:499 gc:universal NODE_106_length_19857_cov_0.799980:17022-18518(+)
MSESRQTCLNAIDSVKEIYTLLNTSHAVVDQLLFSINELQVVVDSLENEDEFFNKASKQVTRIHSFLQGLLPSEDIADTLNSLDSEDSVNQLGFFYKHVKNLILFAPVKASLEYPVIKTQISQESLKISEIVHSKSLISIPQAQKSSDSLKEVLINSPTTEELRKSTNPVENTVDKIVIENFSKSIQELRVLISSKSTISVKDSYRELKLQQDSSAEKSRDQVNEEVKSKLILSEVLQVAEDVVLDEKTVTGKENYAIPTEKPVPITPPAINAIKPSLPSDNNLILPDVAEDANLNDKDRKYKLKGRKDSIKEPGTITEYDFDVALACVDFSSQQNEKELADIILNACKSLKYLINDAFYNQLYVYVKPLEMNLRNKSILHLIASKANIGEALMQYAPLCDPMESLKWYIKAAEAGNVDAMFTVAEIYYYGKGVDVVVYIAERWYRSAAAKGHEKSALILKSILKKKRLRMTWQIILSTIVLLIILAVVGWALQQKWT